MGNEWSEHIPRKKNIIKRRSILYPPSPGQSNGEVSGRPMSLPRSAAKFPPVHSTDLICDILIVLLLIAQLLSQGLNTFNFSSFITLKCFTLLEASVMLFSTAVAAIMASPDRRLEDKVYSST